MSKIGYVRVSTREQNTERQEVMMERLGVEKIFIEKVSGKDVNRPQLVAMLDYVREGDTLVVESLSRLSRSMKDFLWILETLEEKGVALRSQKETIDTSSAMGRFMVKVLAALAEMEREQMLERQAEGIAIARESGKYKGRPPRTDVDMEQFRRDVEAVKRGDAMVKHICKQHNISRSMYYRLARSE